MPAARRAAAACSGIEQTQIAQDGERLVGLGEDLLGELAGAEVLVVQLVGQVHDESQGGRALVVRERPHAFQKDPVGVMSGAPGIDRIDRRQARLQHRGQALLRGAGDFRQGGAHLGRDVDQVGPLTARVVNRGQSLSSKTPPPLGARRPAPRSSRVSTISSRLATRITPYSRNRAS